MPARPGATRVTWSRGSTRLEEQANHLRVPVAYASRLYMLRDHIDLVREDMKKHASNR